MEVTNSDICNHLKKKQVEIKYKKDKLISDVHYHYKIRDYKLRHDAELSQTKSNKNYIINYFI